MPESFFEQAVAQHGDTEIVLFYVRTNLRRVCGPGAAVPEWRRLVASMHKAELDQINFMTLAASSYATDPVAALTDKVERQDKSPYAPVSEPLNALLISFARWMKYAAQAWSLDAHDAVLEAQKQLTGMLDQVEAYVANL